MRGLFTAALAVAALLVGKVEANPATTWTQVAGPIQPPQIANSGIGATFGSAIALSKDKKVMLVGADNMTPIGASYIYTRPSTKSAWQLTQTLLPDISNLNGLYGYAVAMSENGKVMAVSAYNYLQGAGAVFMYRYNRATKQWAQYGPRIDPTVPGTNDALQQFGTSIALDAPGKTLVVGASQYSNVQSQSADGIVYVFKDAPKTASFKLAQTFRPANVDGSAAIFGGSVSISANAKTIAVGAVGLNNLAGGVFMYTWNAKTRQYQLQTTLLPNAVTGFGNVVRLIPLGKMLFVTAQNTVVVYTFENGAWMLSANVQVTNPPADGQFAFFPFDISPSKNGKAFAASKTGPVPGTNGTIWIWNNVMGTWRQSNPITVAKAATALGYSLALSQDAKLLMTGAFSYDTAGDGDGAAYGFAPQK